MTLLINDGPSTGGQSVRALTKSGAETQVVALDLGGAGAEALASGAIPVSGPLTDAALRATPVPVSGSVSTGGLTDAQLRATAVPVSLTSTTITGNVAVTGPLTDAQLRATALPVSGTFFQATQPVSFTWAGLTDAQLRAAPVPVSLTSTEVSNFPVTQAVTGTFWQATQPVSAASLPLPANAATEATLATLAVGQLLDGAASLTARAAVVAGVRRDADGSPVSGDGDVHPLVFNSAGRLKVSAQPSLYTPTTGNITANGGTVAINCSQFSNLMIHCTGTFSTVNVTFEGSLNSTNGTDGNWFTVQAIRSNANTIETTTGNLSAAPAYAWELSVNALVWFRVRATALTSGTQVWTFVPGSYATEPIPGAQISGTQPVSGTVTVTSTRITPNAADGHSTHFHLVSAASTNDTLVLTGARAIGLITATNINAAARYLKVYNKATAPTSADTPIMTILLPPGQTTVVGGNSPIRAPLGIGIRLTTGIAVADTGAVAASEHTVSIAYT